MIEAINPEELRVMAVEQPGSVLLERAARGSTHGRIMLFRSPERVITAVSATEVIGALNAVDEAVAERLYVAGYVAYEAGYALEPTLSGLLPDCDDEVLLWMGCYRAPLIAEFGRPA